MGSGGRWGWRLLGTSYACIIFGKQGAFTPSQSRLQSPGWSTREGTQFFPSCCPAKIPGPFLSQQRCPSPVPTGEVRGNLESGDGPQACAALGHPAREGAWCWSAPAPAPISGNIRKG